MSMGTTNDTTVTISNIPIQIELPDQLDNNGLQYICSIPISELSQISLL